MHTAEPIRPHKLFDPCGKFLPALLYHDIRDRIRGQAGRARARWGKVQRPDSIGKLLWIVAGSTRESVRLGVELARAILVRRLDIGIALTYESEYPDILATIDSNPRIACSYAPADYAGSMHAVWHRLMPFGVILAGVLPRPNMIRLCEACKHALLVCPPGFALGRYERIYPRHRQIYEGRNVAAPADMEVVMLPAPQADDARLATIAAGRTTCLLHGSDEAAAKRIYALFRGHLPQGIMLASGPVTTALARHSTETIALSAWAEQPVPPDRLVLVENTSALAGVMPNVTAAHFAVTDKTLMWLALSAGACLSMPRIAGIDAPSAMPQLRQIEDENELVAHWRRLDEDADLRQSTAAQTHRAFATESALAQKSLSDLLARVGVWQ